jgi:hypothetical protein
LYVTAASIADGKLYALSAAHATLRTIDLAARAVVDARTIPVLARPVGLAIRNGLFYVVSADGELANQRRQCSHARFPAAPRSSCFR